MKTILIILAVLGFTATYPAYGEDSNKLTFMTEDYPPWNFEKDGEIRGISPDLLRLMWKKLGVPEQPIVLLPWSRGYKLVQNKKNHVLMSMTRTAERDPLFKWVGPISTSEYVLIKLAKNKIKLDSIDDAKNYKIAVIKEDAPEQILKSFGFSTDNMLTVNKIQQALKMLQTNRIDALAYEKRSFYSLLKKENRSADEFEATVTISTVLDQYAFHKETADAVILQYQQALDSLKQEHQVILDQYFQ